MTTHDRAAIVSIGDELIYGQTLDTNSRTISAVLAEKNIRIHEHATVPDDLAAQSAVLRRFAASVPLVIVTGGLGPTADDLTRQALAEVMGDTLVLDEPSLRDIEAMFTRRGRAMSDLQRVQAMRPSRARMLPNPNGTAPGLAGTVGTCDIFCLPGPPNEMIPMLRDAVLPILNPPTGAAVVTRVLHSLGLGEGDLAQRLGDLMDRSRNPLVGTTASGGVVSCRIRYEGPPGPAQAAVDSTVESVRRAADPFIFGEGDDTLMSATLSALRARSEKLLTVESCSGGLIGSLLTGVPGASDSYLGGWITYDNALKIAEVGVPERLLREHGAVSEHVAIAMAEGALATAVGSAAHHALAVTGIAGPSGGTATKPVGTVYIALASRNHPTQARRFLISGGRDAVRDRSAQLAIAMLRFRLVCVNPGPLLWEFNR